MKTVPFKIKRQFGPDLDPYWENFEIPHSPNSNVISYLMDIRKNPVNADGIKVPPIVWDCSCLEEVCGTCTMRINGQVRQSCSALVDKLKWPIVLEPMSKFPVNRDLSVDRSRMFDDNPKRGLRIDHIMVSKELSNSIESTGIDYDARAMEKPSDHCPVWLELSEK